MSDDSLSVWFDLSDIAGAYNATHDEEERERLRKEYFALVEKLPEEQRGAARESLRYCQEVPGW